MNNPSMEEVDFLSIILREFLKSDKILKDILALIKYLLSYEQVNDSIVKLIERHCSKEKYGKDLKIIAETLLKEENNREQVLRFIVLSLNNPKIVQLLIELLAEDDMSKKNCLGEFVDNLLKEMLNDRNSKQLIIEIITLIHPKLEKLKRIPLSMIVRGLNSNTITWLVRKIVKLFI